MTAVFFPAEPNALVRPIISDQSESTKRRVDRHDVFGRHALRDEIGLQYAVGRARIDVIGAEKHPSSHLAALLAHQVAYRRDRLLIGDSADIEDVAGAFLTLVLDGIIEQSIRFFEHGQDGFARRRGPTAEHDRNLFLDEQVASLFGEHIPIGGGIDNNGHELAPEQAAFPVLVLDQHQHRVLERGLAHGHGAGQRMQNTDLDMSSSALAAGAANNINNRSNLQSLEATDQRVHADASISS